MMIFVLGSCSPNLDYPSHFQWQTEAANKSMVNRQVAVLLAQSQGTILLPAVLEKEKKHVQLEIQNTCTTKIS